MNKLLTTEVDFLKSAGVSRMDKVRNIKIREIMREENMPDISSLVL
jgi:hypothetical protein